LIVDLSIKDSYPVDLRYLQYFVAVAEELHFTRAAVRLHVTQPALSVQIRKLETEVGARLLSREGRNVRLTQAGRVFLEQSRQMLALARASVGIAQRAASGEIGHLSIGYHNPASFRIFPTIVPAFRKDHPEITLTFHDLRIPQQIERLRRDELDVGFVWLPIPTDEFEVRELRRESLVVLLPVDHRLSSSAEVSIKQLSHEPLILFPRAADPESYIQIEQLFRHAGAVLNVAYELETLLSMIGFVAMGCGCSILPDYVRGIPRQGVAYKRLRPSGIFKSMGVIKKKQATDLAESFFRYTVANAAQTGLGRPRGK
jgi:DNA-binding transcriptional LysR family regulator